MKDTPIQSNSNIQLAMDLHGAAMLDYIDGQQDAAVIMHRDDGFAYPPIVAARWFYEGGFPILDSKALALCQGRILNVGAASGAHSLFLEKQGFDVSSLEASPSAVEVMKRRNVRAPILGGIDTIGDDTFDTILLLCGIGIVGTLDGLERFLERAKVGLREDGLLVTDCTHPRADTLEVSQRYCDQQAARGKYEGERTARFQYKGSFGPWFNWLTIAPELLETHARKAGFAFDVIFSEAGRSLCVLKPSDNQLLDRTGNRCDQ
jgi:hypothetical protein